MFHTSKTFVSIGSEGNHDYAFKQLTTNCKNYTGKKEIVKAKVTLPVACYGELCVCF